MFKHELTCRKCGNIYSLITPAAILSTAQCIKCGSYYLDFKSRMTVEDKKEGKMEAFFYMCFIEGKGTPTVKHETAEIAEAEAERLTRKEGKETYVLAAVKMCIPAPPPPIQWVLPGIE
jgi:hypothetical protein